MTTFETASRRPDISHVLSEDGLTLTSTLTGPDGAAVRAVVSWLDEETALRNYAQTIKNFEAKAPEYAAKAQAGARVRERMFHVGQARIIIQSGPPLMWLPKARINRHEIRFGWLPMIITIRGRRTVR